jgi:hypothetical protein
MSIQDRTDIAHAVAGHCRDFRFRTASNCQSRYGRSPKIVERHAQDTGFDAPLTKRRPKAVWRPRALIRRRENDRAVPGCGVERHLKRRTTSARGVRQGRDRASGRDDFQTEGAGSQHERPHRQGCHQNNRPPVTSQIIRSLVVWNLSRKTANFHEFSTLRRIVASV